MLEDSTKALGELNAYTMIVPNIVLFIQMNITKEANTSSKIEGTKTEIDEIILSKENIDPEKRDDWQEVRNYIDAMNYAIKALNKLPLSNKLLKQTHNILLNSVRGKNKQPGEFRKSQNWIGGSSLKTAFFIPPNHTEVANLMSDLEKFLHNTSIHVPHLIKIAIAHYQFETIHPFLDGNGRIGRLLIPLYLVSNNLLKKPSLYLSSFFEKNRSSYYDSLSNVRVSNDLTQWIKFFLEAIINIANSGVETFENVLKLKKDMDTLVLTFGKKALKANELLEYLYQKPTVSINEVSVVLSLSKTASSNLIKDFQKNNILQEITGFERNKTFVFNKYIKIYSKV